jgi:hypothetical protein
MSLCAYIARASAYEDVNEWMRGLGRGKGGSTHYAL